MEDFASMGDGVPLSPIGPADDTQPMDVDNDENSDSLAEEEVVVLCFLNILLMVSLGQIDGRSIRGPIQEKIVVWSDFFAKPKDQRSPKAYKKTLRCTPDSFDGLIRLLEPLYYQKYGFPGQNTQYRFDFGLAVLLTYYGNGCGIGGDGIGGAAAQLGMSRTVAMGYIKRLEDLLYALMPDVIYFSAPTADDEWDDLVEGFSRRGSDFPDVACVFDGTIIKTRCPRDHMVRYCVDVQLHTCSHCHAIKGFYDKNGKTSYNCLAAVDYREKFRYLGVFSGSNSDQGMWNQSEVLGPRARYLCPLGINWLGDAGFKIWPFLMVPFDERRGKRLNQKQRWYVNADWCGLVLDQWYAQQGFIADNIWVWFKASIFTYHQPAYL